MWKELQVNKEKTKILLKKRYKNERFTEQTTHSVSPAIKKMQIKILMRFYFTLIKLAKIFEWKYQVGKCAEN